MAPRADDIPWASAAHRKVQNPAVGVRKQEESTFQYGKKLDKITRSAIVPL
jgi:hypothetical protein